MELGSSEIGTPKVGALQVGVLEMGFAKVSAPQLSALEWALQSRAFRRSAPWRLTSSLQIRLTEVGALGNRALEVSAPEVGCPPQKIGSHDFGQSLKGFVA